MGGVGEGRVVGLVVDVGVLVTGGFVVAGVDVGIVGSCVGVAGIAVGVGGLEVGVDVGGIGVADGGPAVGVPPSPEEYAISIFGGFIPSLD